MLGGGLWLWSTPFRFNPGNRRNGVPQQFSKTPGRIGETARRGWRILRAPLFLCGTFVMDETQMGGPVNQIHACVQRIQARSSVPTCAWKAWRAVPQTCHVAARYTRDGDHFPRDHIRNASARPRSPRAISRVISTTRFSSVCVMPVPKCRSGHTRTYAQPGSGVVLTFSRKARTLLPGEAAHPSVSTSN